MLNSIQTGQFAQVADDIRLHYVSAGERGKPLVLLLHGFPEFWMAWKDVLPRLGDAVYAVAPDLRGFNLSSAPPELKRYGAVELVTDLVKLIEQLGYRDCVLVAHDWGGALAWSLAIARPDLVRQLVILNSPHPVPFAQALANDPAQQAASAYMNLLRSPQAETLAAADRFAMLKRVFGQPRPDWFDDATAQAYETAWAQPGRLTASLNYYRATPLYPPTATDPGATKIRLRPENFMVKVPTSVLWGLKDHALLPILLDGLPAQVPDLQIARVPQASHWIAHEFPQLVAQHIAQYLPKPV